MVPVLANLHYLTHWPTHGGYNFSNTCPVPAARLVSVTVLLKL